MDGGGISTYYATATIEDSIITNNTSYWGGGICKIATMTIRRLTIVKNHAIVRDGGGIVMVY